MKKEYKISYEVLIPMETFFGMSNKIEKIKGIEIVEANSYTEAQDIFLKDNENYEPVVIITKIELIK